MQTISAIQASANVIRITNVKPGDVYKRFDKSYSDSTFYGVVRAVHNDGENAIIEATEYQYRYSSLDVQHKVLRGSDDYVIFPSSPDELNLELARAKENKLKEIKDAEEKIDKNEKIIKEIDGLMSGETIKQLSAMSYKELTQEQYNTKKAELMS